MFSHRCLQRIQPKAIGTVAAKDRRALLHCPLISADAAGVGRVHAPHQTIDKPSPGGRRVREEAIHVRRQPHHGSGIRQAAAVAHGLSDNLVARAADVVLKERRRLVLMVRETPLNLAHLRNMVAVTEMGGIVFPPVPALYQRPASVAELVDQTVGRVLDLVAVAQTASPAWPGLTPGGRAGEREAVA